MSSFERSFSYGIHQGINQWGDLSFSTSLTRQPFSGSSRAFRVSVSLGCCYTVACIQQVLNNCLWLMILFHCFLELMLPTQIGCPHGMAVKGWEVALRLSGHFCSKLGSSLSPVNWLHVLGKSLHFLVFIFKGRNHVLFIFISPAPRQFLVRETAAIFSFL